jgi:hypothetical protein
MGGDHAVMRQVRQARRFAKSSLARPLRQA